MAVTAMCQLITTFRVRRERLPMPIALAGSGTRWGRVLGQTECVTRVIAGTAGGRRIAVPPGRDTRPTSDRAREGLFPTVHSLLGELDGLRVVDLFAGSGAVGLEALSRGAGHVLLVESSPRAVKVIKANIDALGLPG